MMIKYLMLIKLAYSRIFMILSDENCCRYNYALGISPEHLTHFFSSIIL
jgi:hypothetical protein